MHTPEAVPLGTKTLLLALCRVSLVNKKSRRISKKIQDMSIADILTSLRGSEKLHSLWLYSSILLGVANVYVIKTRSCHSEASFLLKSLDARKRCLIRTRREKNILATETGFIDSICDSEFDNMNYTSNSMFGSGLLEVMELPDKDTPKRRNRIFDDVLELERDKHFIAATNPRRNVFRMQRFRGEDVFVIERIKKLVKTKKNDIQGFDCSEMPTFGSIERMRNFSAVSMGFDVECFPEDSSWEFLVDNLNFNNHMKDRRNKGLGFYKVLELSSNGMIKPIQDKPYGCITIRLM